MSLKTKIYYFSSSGNSLSIARCVAEKANGTLIPISSLMEKEKIAPEADVIGLVFPAYYATNDYGIPSIVSRFVNKLEKLGSKYIFAVCTCGHMPGTTIENLRKAITSQGGELACGFTVRMSNKKLPIEKQQKIVAKRQKKLESITEYLAARKEGKFETRGPFRK